MTAQDYVLTITFRDQHNALQLVREQVINEFDSIPNALRRHGRYAEKYLTRNPTHRATIRITPKRLTPGYTK